ncbi:hypothetical protein [Viridibacterium curvum]|uniref:Uncharacterized protein n=1 Tax=Viridibacterium curvum TaxID=1101404 RepID=A0ABP9R852_9RHOO
MSQLIAKLMSPRNKAFFVITLLLIVVTAADWGCVTVYSDYYDQLSGNNSWGYFWLAIYMSALSFLLGVIVTAVRRFFRVNAWILFVVALLLMLPFWGYLGMLAVWAGLAELSIHSLAVSIITLVILMKSSLAPKLYELLYKKLSVSDAASR